MKLILETHEYWSDTIGPTIEVDSYRIGRGYAKLLVKKKMAALHCFAYEHISETEIIEWALYKRLDKENLIQISFVEIYRKHDGSFISDCLFRI